ncbi:T9SS type A sorting domain-containing protein [Salibacter halophilus]|uniref:DUF4397 domain-containing protein n=1 Tax=Salibacter halophilus TaxID=1803916 RepID=A0A6N6M6I7_9FLAO|nr:DUF4397 domain-containing protein [Salibacter halophilus]KAB1063234.1 DUF4397 domain-containing protein [Salibacter halophilus]
MKKLLQISSLVFTLLVGINSIAQTARVQVIHNSPDVNAQTVDVWVNNMLALDDFEFRTATPFLDLPAGVPVEIRVKGSNSQDTTNPLFFTTQTLQANETYVAVANGLVSQMGYSNFEPFTISIFPTGREQAANQGASETDVLAFHGATDAPTVDIAEVGVGAGTIIDDLNYGSFSASYLSLNTADYTIQVQDQTGAVTVREYAAPLQTLGLQDSALVVLASGFLDPSANNNSEGFGLYVALPSGGQLIELPMSTATAQFAHNSADMAAEVVDIYMVDPVGVTLAKLDDVTYQSATGFLPAPASIDNSLEVQAVIAPDTSTSPASGIYTQNIALSTDSSYVAIASGIVSGSGYNPSQPFNIDVFEGARSSSQNAGQVDVLVYHGATDAPTVDVFENTLGATIVDDLDYGSFQGYINAPLADLDLTVRDGSGSIDVRNFNAPLATLGLGDTALTVVASGFLDPSQNSDGQEFGLYAILPQGGPFVELPMQTAQMQIIHNSADMAAETVDLYAEGPAGEQLGKIDDVSFRTATPFMEVPSGIDLTFHVADESSMDFSNSIFDKTVILNENSSNIVIANGIVSQSGYTPDASQVGFDLYLNTNARTEAANSGETDVLVFHGATDAPTVDVVEVDAGAGTLVDDIDYGNFSSYLELATADYQLNVTSSDGQTTVAGFSAPLATLNLQDSAITVLASGFLDPSQNSNGEAFGLWAALPEGGNLVELPSVPTSVDEVVNKENVSIYPNPAVDQLTIELPNDVQGEVEIYDMLGSMVRTDRLNSARNVIDMSELSAGQYIYRIKTDNTTLNGKVMKIK